MKRLGGIWAWAPLAGLLVLGAAFVTILAHGGGERGFAADAMIGQPAPAYALAALDGGNTVTPLAGEVHVVNFFASWCAPCRIEQPLLMDIAARGALIVGVAYKDTPEKTRAMLRELGDPFVAVGLDPGGRAGLDFGLRGVPETFVISADGRVLAVHRGPLDRAAIERTILPALR
ncbi:MAG: DsbE family thiol:disulfide interchange protein [Hyphomonadaceae bacterium]